MHEGRGFTFFYAEVEFEGARSLVAGKEGDVLELALIVRNLLGVSLELFLNGWGRLSRSGRGRTLLTCSPVSLRREPQG